MNGEGFSAPPRPGVRSRVTVSPAKKAAKGTKRPVGRKAALRAVLTAGGKRPSKDTPWRRIAALPPRLWLALGAVLLAVLVFWPADAPERKPPAPSFDGATETAGPLVPAVERPVTAPVAPTEAHPQDGPVLVRSVRLVPLHPTRRDRLRAEVAPDPAAPGDLEYTYRWRVNDRPLPEAQEAVLDLSPFRKGDLVGVAVTPYGGARTGAVVESPLVLIQSLPPALELADVRQERRPGQPLELQLVGAAPDGKITGYNLVEPFVSGMSVDAATGRILWRLGPEQKGSFRFGAAVADDNGVTVTKTFEITVGELARTPAPG